MAGNSLGSMVITLEGNTVRLESDMGRAAAITETRSREMARSVAMVDKAIASQRGISENVLQPYLKQLDAVGVSAGQTAAALRSLPAQFTDIVTSLQGGQQPLTVLIQQGGQLKDMFGGIGPAARAMGGYVAGLISPLTLAAAGAGALAVAMYQGSKEAEAYAKALVLTGNYLGMTTDQLAEQAAQIAKTTGTQHQAAEALASLANSGKIAGESLTEVGAAVVTMNRVLGTAVDDATAIFVKLAEEPAKASAKLNETQHYLTLGTYERIRALEEQGRKEEAAALAQTTYANATNSRLASVEAQAGSLAKAWRFLAKEANAAWDFMQGIGRAQTTGDKLADLQKTLADRIARGPTNDLTAEAFAKGNTRLQQQIADISRRAVREQENAFAEGERARNESAKIAASGRLETLTKEIQTNAQKRKKAIEDLNRDFKTLGKETSGPEYDKLVAGINEKFKDPKAGGGKGRAEPAFHDEAATRFIESIRQQEASLREQLSTNEKLTESERARAKFVQLIADLKDKKELTAEQKSLLASQDAIKAELDKYVALEKQVEAKKEQARLDKEAQDKADAYARQIAGINLTIESAARSRSEQFDRQLAAFGLGDRARQEVEAQKAIRNEFARLERQATKAASDQGQLGSQKYRDDVERIREALAEALAVQEKYWAELKKRQGDWQNGATTALANYIDQINNVSAATERAFTDGFKGAEDALVGFVTTGKGSVKSLADSIIQQFARIAIQQMIMKPIASGLMGLFGGGSGNIDWVTGAGKYSNYVGVNGIEGFAGGGNPPVGKVSVIGENGPELWMPKEAGTIVPNGAWNPGGSGGSQPIYLTINNSVGDIATLSQLKAAQAGTERRIAAALDRSQRYGGRMAAA
jgi:lambda family phage tail tape measure protein